MSSIKEIVLKTGLSQSTIGVILTSDDNIYYNSLIDSIKLSAEKISSFNYNVILETMKGYDIERQINLLDQLSEKAEVIIITPINHPDINK